ncbi:MAG: hypothetical protein ACKV22_30935 [Bryobacteraceae bacterium]
MFKRRDKWRLFNQTVGGVREAFPAPSSTTRTARPERPQAPCVAVDEFQGRQYPRQDGMSATWRRVVGEAEWISGFAR